MAYQEPNKEGFYGRFGGRFVPNIDDSSNGIGRGLSVKVQARSKFPGELNQLLRQSCGT